MTGADIEEEFNSLPPAPWSTIRYLHDHGVSTLGLTEPDQPRSARIIPSRSAELFNIAPEGDDRGAPAMLFLERNVYGEAIDMVAWLSSNRLLSWNGAAALLGQPEIYGLHLTTQSACPVFRSPLDWLRADRRGVVIVRPEKAAFALAGARLLAEDHRHRLDLEKLMRPKILVPPKE